MGKNTNVFDKDINPVLENATNEDLQYLVDLLTGTFSNLLEVNSVYKENQPNHKAYADLIAKEICEYGGNSFVNVFRGSGPAYKEIVCDVASKLKVPYNKERSIEEIEDSILEVILRKALDKMTDEEKQELLKEMGEKKSLSLTGPALTSTFIVIFRAGGFKSYQITLILVNVIAKAILGRGLSFVGNYSLLKGLSILTGPLGWAVSGIWATVDLAGPAYRVTIPAIVYIAMLRKKYNTPLCPHCKQMISIDAKFCSECGGAI